MAITKEELAEYRSACDAGQLIDPDDVAALLAAYEEQAKELGWLWGLVESSFREASVMMIEASHDDYTPVGKTTVENWEQSNTKTALEAGKKGMA